MHCCLSIDLQFIIVLYSPNWCAELMGLDKGADDTELTAISISKHNLNSVLVLLHILQFFKLISCIL